MSRSHGSGCPNGRGCGVCLDAGENARSRKLTREHGEIDLQDGLAEAEEIHVPDYCDGCDFCDPFIEDWAAHLRQRRPLSVPLVEAARWK